MFERRIKIIKIIKPTAVLLNNMLSQMLDLVLYISKEFLIFYKLFVFLGHKEDNYIEIMLIRWHKYFSDLIYPFLYIVTIVRDQIL